VRHVFHLFIPGGPAAVGELRALAADDAERVRRVLRLRPGDALTVADGAGTVFAARLAGDGVELTAELAPAPAPTPLGVRLALAGARAETAVEKLVELGVERIGPLSSAAAGRAPRLERWVRIARAAAEQSKRPRLPIIDGPVALAAALRPGALLLSHEEPDGDLDAALARVTAPVELLVGPEAGFDAAELAAARAAGVPIATLGPLLLRSETAAIVAAALALDRLGELALR